MKDHFWCGSCGNFKKNDLQTTSVTGKRKICQPCADRAHKARKRIRATKAGTG